LQTFLFESRGDNGNRKSNGNQISLVGTAPISSLHGSTCVSVTALSLSTGQAQQSLAVTALQS